MFYAHIILAKKGPLARVWLAAHWDKKITKAHVFETNIEKSVEGIMQPKVKLALRTSGHLLLGVVRIYSRKAKYLLADCNEAFLKIKMAFRPGMVDLPEGHREANVNAITLPEVFHDFDTALPELNDIDIEAQFSINQSRADEITMREDYGSLSLPMHDDGFGDLESADLIREGLDSQLDDELFQSNIEGVGENNPESITMNEADIASAPLDNDAFGDDFGAELFEEGLFGEPHMDKLPEKSVELETGDAFAAECDNFNVAIPGSPISSGLPSPVAAFHDDEADETLKKDDGNEPVNDVVPDQPANQSTLLQNEEESFALAPIDATAYRGVTKNKRKRKLIVDEVKNISGEEMKAQLANTSDIVTTLDLAPPTKSLMYWKETGGVEKLFSLPTRTIPARVMFANYQRNLTTRITHIEDFSCLGPNDLLGLDHLQNETEDQFTVIKRGRKRKQDALADSSHQNVSVPEQIRESEQASINQTPLEFLPPQNTSSMHQASLELPPPESNFSPGHMLQFNDNQTMEQMPLLSDIPFTPGNLHHGQDDDFNHDDLNHGHMTPHQATMELIDSIPLEQNTQIFNEIQAANLQPHASEIASDWNECDVPVGGQNINEEQMEDETDEQFEERVLNKRAAQLFGKVKNRLLERDSLYLSDLTYNNTRKQAAQKFYSLLVLKKFRALNIEQDEPYGQITVRRGALFDNPKL